MIEIVTTNGFRRMINVLSIATIGELRSDKRSNTVITLTNGEKIFADDNYDIILKAYRSVEASAND